ncbi:FAD binding domain-containing protein [Akanthomyces lecanii RCEF 1005]|uniref:FAD binding domain-containing protein n=1 Tax=Akanthomyces lecanii RCEF 1005 TaxID=1081108 RepID=A0A168IKC6_CORDF|nr:FAD binding domain-containing protein [Akanthomyces lecanii RCEF 1005]
MGNRISRRGEEFSSGKETPAASMGDGGDAGHLDGHSATTTINGEAAVSKTTIATNGQHSTGAQPPVLIIGAGPSGLLLAQSLRRRGVAFRILERDADFTTRGVGWGLTLNWALPIMRALLPDGLGDPDTLRAMACVDRRAVEDGSVSRFPYYDLTTAERIAAAPPAPETARLRVTRERLRSLLATNLDIEWNMNFTASEDHGDSITAHFEDGSAIKGSLVVACDGAKSLLRKELFAQQDKEHTKALPIRMLGVKLSCTPEEIAGLRKMDPFFLHGTSSHDNSFGYFSILDAPGNTKESTDNYLLQICISWLEQAAGFRGQEEPTAIPETNEGRVELFRSIGASWAEPFRSIAMKVCDDDEVKGLKLMDWVPPEDLRSSGRAVLMGDSLHVMTMFRGDGANHALADVEDFDRHVVPQLVKAGSTTTTELREALSRYEASVIMRARPGIFASRQAGHDAHDFEKMTMKSPLLTPRMKNLNYEEPS